MTAPLLRASLAPRAEKDLRRMERAASGASGVRSKRLAQTRRTST